MRVLARIAAHPTCLSPGHRVPPMLPEHRGKRHAGQFHAARPNLASGCNRLAAPRPFPAGQSSPCLHSCRRHAAWLSISPPTPDRCKGCSLQRAPVARRANGYVAVKREVAALPQLRTQHSNAWQAWRHSPPQMPILSVVSYRREGALAVKH